MENNNAKLICKLCNYETNHNQNWFVHIRSEKHLRNGNKKSTKCDLCNYESISHWNINIHKKTTHLPKEEKEKLKYYCKVCDFVLLCPSYFNKHINGKHHLNKVLINESLKEIDEILVNKNYIMTNI